MDQNEVDSSEGALIETTPEAIVRPADARIVVEALDGVGYRSVAECVSIAHNLAALWHPQFVAGLIVRTGFSNPARALHARKLAEQLRRASEPTAP